MENIMQKSIYFWLLGLLFISHGVLANPWNGKVVFQGFWWGAENQNYPQDWYTYLAKLAPRLRDMGFDGIWVPSPSKGWQGSNDMGYGIYDHYDLGDKNQKNTVATRFGSKDSLLRFIAVAHANGLDVYPDVVLNHVIGGDFDTNAPGDKYKKFRLVGYAGQQSGRWPKDHWNFHPNPDHDCNSGDICGTLLGADICFLGNQQGGGGNGQYMLDKAREWLVWFKKQTDADGFRLDAVKHFPAFVVEDVLYNAMGPGNNYFCAGEFVSGANQLDQWADATQNRCGTFDFSLRNGLAAMVDGGGFFDMSSLPDMQQKNRLKTSPFLNNHDTWKGAFWDSATTSSTQHDDRSGDWRQSNDEILPTIDPDNPRSQIAYAAAFSVDGSPTVYFEDLFVNYGPNRFKADPAAIAARDYLVNIIWAHQKLDFKDAAYKVRYRNSADLLVIERSGKALIGLNDSGTETLNAWVQTD
ncbi:partial alpha-amylase, partial [Methylococcales bacterium]